ncbi:DNA mismatch repair protein MutS [Clostridia bacterium]|nr:DNA mismatch repair protein MutS [Clostridia bacterium]
MLEGIILAAVIALAILSTRHRRTKLANQLNKAWAARDSASSLSNDEIEDVALFYRKQNNTQGSRITVDDTTWNDLNMDAVFQYLNRTHSSTGEETLYSILRNIGVSDETLSRRSSLIKTLGDDADTRIKLQLLLSRIGKDRYHGAVEFMSNPSRKQPNHAWMYYALASLPIAFLAAGIFIPSLLLGIAVSFAVNVVVFYRSQAEWMPEYHAIRHLSRVLNCANRMQKVTLDDVSDELRGLCRKLKPIARWNALYAMSSSNPMDFITVYIRIAFLLDIISLSRLAAFISKYNDDVIRLYELVGEIDSCIAIASVRASLDVYSQPEFTRDNAVTAVGLAHPLIKNPIRNDINWNENSLLTGSNASGKSTFTKALAVNAIFAQTICTCWAERFAMPRAQVLSSMALRDDVVSGESYFIVEIKSLRRILSSLRQDIPTLCFIDEILRGTNTIERIASSTALLTYLAGQNVLCLAATHDIELTQLLPMYRQYHFTEDITPEGMTFSYKLMDGASNTRNAIKLLERMDFPAQVVSSAEDTAARFIESGVWRAF